MFGLGSGCGLRLSPKVLPRGQLADRLQSKPIETSKNDRELPMNNIRKLFSQVKNNNVISVVLTLVVMVMIVQAGSKLLSECTILPNIFSPWFAAAIVLAVIYRIVNAYGWALVLRAMNQQVDGVQATRIWLRSESRRWLPGGVWGYASRATQAKSLNVSTSVASASMLLELLLTMAAALIVVAPVAFFFGDDLITAIGGLELSSQLVWLVMSVLFGTIALGFTFRQIVFKKLNSLRSRLGAFKGVRLSGQGLVTALIFYTSMGLLNGCVTLFLVWSMPGEAAPASVIIAATSLAWVIGFLAIFAPGGLFVREAIFAACLAPWTPYGTAIALAVLARLLQMAAEFLGMLWVAIPTDPKPTSQTLVAGPQ